MALKSRGDVIRELKNLTLRSRDTDDKLNHIHQLQKEFERIHRDYEDTCGARFGIDRQRTVKVLQGHDLERLMHLIRAEASQPRKTGFLGIGGIKKEEYYNLTGRLNIVHSSLAKLEEEEAADRNLQVEAFQMLYRSYDTDYREMQAFLRKVLRGSDFSFPAKCENANLYLGELLYEIPDAACIRNIFEVGDICSRDKNNLKILCKQEMEQPTSCLLTYEKEDQLEMIHRWIKNLFRQVIYQIPLYQYEFYMLDEMNNASGLGEMLDLQNMRDSYAEGVVPELCGQGFQMLRVGRDMEEIRNYLQYLEKYMGKVTDLLQGEPFFREYNRNNEEKIPYRIVVFEGVESVDKVLMRKLINNASKCGVFVIIVIRKSQLEAADMAQENGVAQFCCEDGTFYYRKIENKQQCFTRMLLYDAPGKSRELIDKINQEVNGRKIVDNSFASCFPDSYVYGQYTSTVKGAGGNLEGRIEIPYAVDKRGKISSIELGSAGYAHGLISGATGSGKSTLLHMLINSVVMNYRPDDVEIWLADYKKVEMAVYMKERPPHIKFIGIERNEEFTFCLLDLITGEYERRLELFRRENVRNIDIYKDRFGMGSLPRILLIIDEFHLMAQQVYDNPVYSRKLENLLSEGRGAGIVCLFADQSISKGLNGLTQKGKDQMRMRLAMANTKEDMEVTLDMRVTEAETVLDKGEVRIKRMKTELQSGEKVPYLDLERVIYISDESRRNVANKATALYGNGGEAIIVDGNREAAVNWKEAEEYEKKVFDGREVYHLHLGIPSNLEKCFTIPLYRNDGNNVICILEKQELQKRILFSAIKSFCRAKERKAYILADDNDVFFQSVYRELQAIAQDQENVTVVSEYMEICPLISGLKEEMIRRRREKSGENILLLWLGLDSMFGEFSYYEKRKPRQRTEQRMGGETEKLFSELDGKFASFFDEKPQEVTWLEEEDLLYDATDDVAALISEGAKRGLFQFVFLSSLLTLKRIREIKTDYFKYKVSGYLNKDDCLMFFGTAKFMESMTGDAGGNPGDMLVCYDGTKGRFFLPYLTEGQKGEREENHV